MNKQQMLNAVDNLLFKLQNSKNFIELGTEEIVKSRFKDIINNTWDDSKSNTENTETIKKLFKLNEIIYNMQHCMNNSLAFKLFVDYIDDFNNK